MKAYHIVQWHPLYEKSDTRKTDYMGWYAKQTKLVGLGIGRTLRETYPRNMELLGTWNMIEVLASQSALIHRGWLVRGGMPLDFEGMSALLPTVPPEAFERACAWFCGEKIHWLELIDFTPESVAAVAKRPANFPAGGRLPGNVPANFPAGGDGRELGGGNSATERERDREVTERQRSNKNKKGVERPDAAPEQTAAQKAQFAAASARVAALGRIPEEDRSEEQEEELREMQGLVKKIQKKQARGDFSPVVQTPGQPAAI